MPRCVPRAAIVLIALVAATAAHAQTVDEIIAKNLQAKGGEKWKAVNAVKLTGTIAIEAGPQPIEGAMTIYAKRPNYNRQEITIKDVEIVQAFDGTTAWFVNPMMGADKPTPVPGPMGEITRAISDFDGVLLNYKEKGHKVELVGKEKVGSQDAYHLKVTLKSGQEVHYFLDANTGVELKQTSMLDLGTGQKQSMVNEMSDNKQVQGIMIPHTMTQSVDGKTIVRMTIQKVEFNPPIDDGLFKMK